MVVITREGIVDPFLKRENIFLKGFDHFVPNAYVFMGKMVEPPGIANGQRCLRLFFVWYWPRQRRRCLAWPMGNAALRCSQKTVLRLGGTLLRRLPGVEFQRSRFSHKSGKTQARLGNGPIQELIQLQDETSSFESQSLLNHKAPGLPRSWGNVGAFWSIFSDFSNF